MPAPLGTDAPTDQYPRITDPRRLEVLQSSGLLDGRIAPVLDRLTRIASVLLGVPVSLVSLVDNLGQHFPGLNGLGGWAGDRRGTPLSHSFCRHVVGRDERLVVTNAAASAIAEIELRRTVQALCASNEQLRQQTTPDALTGLCNRQVL
jgi:hypothetical protein